MKTSMAVLLLSLLNVIAADAGPPQRPTRPTPLPHASGVYLGQKWEVDEDHMLWWAGKPYIPYASFGIGPDTQLGITEFNPWIDNDPFAAHPGLTRAQHIENTRRRLEAVTKASGTCLPLLAIASPVLPDGYDAAQSRAARQEGGAVTGSAMQLADPEVKRRIVKVWEEYAPALRQPCVRGLILWNEINLWRWDEQRSPEEHARVLGEYVKEARRIFGDLPVIFKIAGTLNALPVISAAAKYADGLGFDVWFSSAEGTEARWQIGEALRLLQERQTKTTWFFIAEGGRCAGPEHREGEGEYWDFWPPFRSAQEARDMLRAYALLGAKGFVYVGPPSPSYRQSQQWFAQLKPEIVRLMRETKPRFVVPRISNAEQAIAAVKADVRVKKMLADYKGVEAQAEFSDRSGVWLVHFSTAGKRVGFASVSGQGGEVVEVRRSDGKPSEKSSVRGQLGSAAVQPQPPSPDDIAAKSQQAFHYAGRDMTARVVMTLLTAGGEQRVRDLAMLRRNGEAGRQKYFLYFHSPADVRGTAFLVNKEPGRDAARWLFIPALNLVQRIAARDAESSFVGSDFSYEDISGRLLTLDTHKLLREETLDGKPCHVIESVPKSRASFTRKLAWIERASLLPLKEEYYDAQKELFKVFTADEVRDVDGLPAITKRTMRNIKSGHRTEVVFRQVKYNVGMTEDVFTERSLRRPPAQWISGD